MNQIPVYLCLFDLAYPFTKAACVKFAPFCTRSTSKLLCKLLIGIFCTTRKVGKGRPGRGSEVDNRADEPQAVAANPEAQAGQTQQTIVVGIGASAGGLAALQTFFAAVAPDLG